MISSGEPLELSTKHVFGKFDAFCERIHMIVELLEWHNGFAELGKSSLDCAKKASDSIMSAMKLMQEHHKDLLDLEDIVVSSEFVKIVGAAKAAESQVQAEIAIAINEAATTQTAIDLLEQFERLPKLNMNFAAMVSHLFARFCSNELEATRRLYQKAKDRPPSPWHMPPAAGAIAWSRQLLHIIETPMAFFWHQKSLSLSADYAIKLQHYNALAKSLVEYQLLWHEHWSSSVRSLSRSLQVPILMIDEQRGIQVNLDPDLTTLTQEVTWMGKLDLPVPSEAFFLANKCHRLKPVEARLSALLERLQAVRQTASRTPELEKVVSLLASNLEEVLQPGLRYLTW